MCVCVESQLAEQAVIRIQLCSPAGASTRCEGPSNQAPEAAMCCHTLRTDERCGPGSFGDLLGRGPFRCDITVLQANQVSILRQNKKCLCCIDCLAEERGVPKEQVKTWIPYPGGAPANVAAALGRLGVKVSFVSAVGQDELGEQMLDLLQSNDKPVCHCILPKSDHFLLLVKWPGCTTDGDVTMTTSGCSHTSFCTCRSPCGFNPSAESTRANPRCFGDSR